MSERVKLVNQFMKGRITRREFMQRALMVGLSLPTVSSFIAACAPVQIQVPATPTAAPAATPVPAGPKKGGILISAVTTDAPGLDPQLIGALARIRMMSLVYDELLRIGNDGGLEPWLVTEWEMQDENTWLFQLREGVKWHNGDDFVADDVVFSMQRWKDVSPFAGVIDPVESVTAVDTHTVQIITKHPFAPLPGVLAGRRAAVVNPRAVQEAPEQILNNTATGTGPFMLDEWLPGEHLKLTRFPDYWDQDRIHLDGITFQIIPESSSIIAALRGGTVHHTLLEDNKDFLLVKDDPDLVVHRGPRFSYTWLMLNTEKEPLNDVKVRQALALAIDYQNVIQAAASGLATLSGNIPPSMEEWALPLSELETMLTPDKEKARALLAEAGYPDGFETEILAISTFPTTVASAEVIAAEWQAIGVQADIQTVELSVWLDKILRPGDYTTAMNLGFTGTDADEWLYNYFHSTGLNLNRWADPEVDALLEEGQSAEDHARRKEIYAEAQRLLLERLPQIPLYSAELIDVTQTSVKDFEQRPTSFFDSLQYCWLDV